MTKIQLANSRYFYIHDDCEGPHPVDTHHIVIKRNSAWVFLAHLFVLLLFIKAIYLCLLNVPGNNSSRSSKWLVCKPSIAHDRWALNCLPSATHVRKDLIKFLSHVSDVYVCVVLSNFNLLLSQGTLGSIFLLSMLSSACLVKSYYGTLIEKESVVIIPSLGVQLEAHYWGGRVVCSFIPIDKILQPVLNENVTPFTCYWSLVLLVCGKKELILAFKVVKPPVKLLVPIWKALCAATCSGETADSPAEDK